MPLCTRAGNASRKKKASRQPDDSLIFILILSDHIDGFVDLARLIDQLVRDVMLKRMAGIGSAIAGGELSGGAGGLVIVGKMDFWGNGLRIDHFGLGLGLGSGSGLEVGVDLDLSLKDEFNRDDRIIRTIVGHFAGRLGPGFKGAVYNDGIAILCF